MRDSGPHHQGSRRVHAVILTRDRTQVLDRCVDTALSTLGSDDTLTVLDDSCAMTARVNAALLAEAARRSTAHLTHLRTEQLHNAIAQATGGSIDMLTHPSIQIGDTAQFPLESRQLGNDDAKVYRYRWEAIAFLRDGILVRRRHDGIERTISDRIWRAHATDYRLTDRSWQTDQRAKVQAMRLRHPRPRGFYKWEPDTQPGPYFVTVIDGPRTAFLAGPYATHFDALDHVELAREKAEQADPRAVWYHYGTARAKDGQAYPTVFGML